MRRLGEFFDVQHREGGVGDGLAKHRLGIGAERRLQFFGRTVRADKGEFNAHALHGNGKQVVGAAVDGAAAHYMVAAAGDIEHRVKAGRLPAGGEHGRAAAFQRADLGRHRIVGGVLQPGVKIPLGLQIKQFAHILAGRIFKGGALDDGNLPGLAVARRIPALHTDTVQM